MYLNTSAFKETGRIVRPEHATYWPNTINKRRRRRRRRRRMFLYRM